MSTRFAKQLVYGAFYLIIWGLVVWGGYKLFTRAAPSCFDNAQNQGEIGVDCGGPCARICTASTAPPVIASVNAFPAGAGHDTFLAKIVNLNADYAAESFDYAFNVYDAGNSLLQSFSGHSFLYAGELKYLLLPNQAIPSGVVNADLTLSNVHWVPAASFGPKPKVDPQNVVTQAGSSTIVASGQAINQDVMAFANVLVIGIFKDEQGKPIGASQTVIDGIAPNQTKNFSIIYPAVSGIDPKVTEVVVYAGR